MSAGGLGPDSHTVWILLGVGLDRRGNPTIRVSLSQDRVDGTAHYGLVSLLDFSLAIVLWLTRIHWDIITLGTQFGNAIFELIQRSGN